MASTAQTLRLTIELEQETEGKWIAEVLELPGVMTYGSSREEALSKAKRMALFELADRIEHGEPIPGDPAFSALEFVAA